MIPIVGDSRGCATHRHTPNTPGTDAPAVTVGAATTPEAGTDWHTAIIATLCGRYSAYRHIYSTRAGDRAGRLYATATDAAAAIAAGRTVVSPIAPDMIVFDLDGCAVPAVLEALDALSTLYGALLAYRAASGSRNSEHRVYAAPPAVWSRFRAAVRSLEVMHRPEGVTRWALDDRTANQTTRNGRLSHGLRLPLSPSLKPGGGPVVPLDAAGHPVSLETAALMVRSARLRAGLSLAHGYGVPRVTTPTETTPEAAPVAPLDGEQATPAPSSTPARSGAPTAAERSSTRRGPAPVMVGVGGEFTPTERLLLETVVPEGLRSDAALPAVRAVVRRCGTAWSAVRSLVMSAPVFRKFAAGGESRARSWWEQTAGGYAQWLADHRTGGTVEPLRLSGRLVAVERPEATPEQTDAVLSWLEASRGRLWGTYGVQRAARAWSACLFIGRRMLDGRGLEARPVSVRDLVVWGVVGSAMGGSHVLRDLEAAGVLVVAADYDISAPLEARRWSLPEGADTTVTGVFTPPLVSGPLLSALTGPGCSWLPPTLQAALAWSSTAPLRAAALSEVLQVSVRSVRRWCERLASAGLVERVGDAWRSVAVERLEAVAGAAPEAAAAAERLEAARARVADDRAGWRRLWAASTDAAGRVVWRFRHWLRRSVSSAASAPSSDAATCGDAAAPGVSSTGVLSGVARRPVVPVLSAAVRVALPGLEAPPGGWLSSWSSSWSAPSAVMARSGVERARGGPGAPGAGEWPDGPPERLSGPTGAASVRGASWRP